MSNSETGMKANDDDVESEPKETCNSLKAAQDEGNSSGKENESSTLESPTLGEDVDTMIDLSQLIGSFAEVRKLVRGYPEKYKGAATILQNEDIMGSEVLKFVEANSSVLRDELGNEGLEKYEMLVNVISRLEKSHNVRSFLEQKFVNEMGAIKIVAFDDVVTENSFMESDLVYGIGFNSNLKVITVAFRQSATVRDWITNFRSNATNHENPLKGRQGQSDFLRIHKGFVEYLFYKKNELDLNKYETILKKVEGVCNENPGSKIYFTGNSLGAAEATLAAFHLAAEESQHITKPVRCITIGSPFVGDQTFRNAYMFLEKDGLLQHLRISNDWDMFTAMPNSSFLPLCSYKHVGIHFRLLGDGEYSISYPRNGNSDAEEVRKNNLLNYVIRPIAGLFNHQKEIYDKKVKGCMKELSKFTLEGLYQDKNLIGDFRNIQQSDFETEKDHGDKDNKKGKRDLHTELWCNINDVFSSSPLCSDLFHRY